jgi:hypothetical protein
VQSGSVWDNSLFALLSIAAQTNSPTLTPADRKYRRCTSTELLDEDIDGEGSETSEHIRNSDLSWQQQRQRRQRRQQQQQRQQRQRQRQRQRQYGGIAPLFSSLGSYSLRSGSKPVSSYKVDISPVNAPSPSSSVPSMNLDSSFGSGGYNFDFDAGNEEEVEEEDRAKLPPSSLMRMSFSLAALSPRDQPSPRGQQRARLNSSSSPRLAMSHAQAHAQAHGRSPRGGRSSPRASPRAGSTPRAAFAKGSDALRMLETAGIGHTSGHNHSTDETVHHGCPPPPNSRPPPLPPPLTPEVMARMNGIGCGVGHLWTGAAQQATSGITEAERHDERSTAGATVDMSDTGEWQQPGALGVEL